MNIDNRAAPVRVAYVLPGLERGGAEKNVLDLAARLSRRRFLPRVVSLTGGGALEAAFRDIDVPVRILPYTAAVTAAPAPLRPLRLWRYLLRFRDLLAADRVAVLHSFLPMANILGSFAGALAGTPVRIVSKVALCLYKKGRPVYSLLEDAANLASDAVLANSSAVAEDVKAHERFWSGKIRVVRNGVAPPAAEPPPIASLCPELAGDDGAVPIACIANFHPYKGHAELVAAARLVADAFPAARFLLVGRDAGELAAVRRRVAELGLARHVLFAGERPDAPAIAGASALVVHPSLQEGFANAILEAMAAGRAVVATRVGGNPEAVEDGRTGLLVPPGDPAALAAALIALLKDPARARAMGDEGRRRALAEFSLDKMTAEVEDLYDGLLAAKAGKGGRR